MIDMQKVKTVKLIKIIVKIASFNLFDYLFLVSKMGVCGQKLCKRRTLHQKQIGSFVY